MVIYVCAGYLKLIDYGLAKHVTKLGSKTNSFVGSPLYMAPEVIGEKAYGRMVDYWALGLLVFEMLVGRSPWADLGLTDMFFRILTEDPVFPDTMSPDARDFVSSLLVKDPSKRLGCR